LFFLPIGIGKPDPGTSHFCFLLAIVHETTSYFFDSASEFSKIKLTNADYGLGADVMIILVLSMSAPT